MIDTETLARTRRASTAELTAWWITLQAHDTPPPLAALGWPRPCQRSELLRLLESVVGQRVLHQALSDALACPACGGYAGDRAACSCSRASTLDAAVAKGRAAWADVPDANRWVEQQRGEPEGPA